ncbi:MAG: hypothetical protein K0A98_14440, partial [Trueperaceae bacterium]|nr:hypothetical protein [Trueperaceae bacterium]
MLRPWSAERRRLTIRATRDDDGWGTLEPHPSLAGGGRGGKHASIGNPRVVALLRQAPHTRRDGHDAPEGHALNHPANPTTPTLLGLDLGSSSLKALLLGLDGRVLAERSAAYPTR